MIERTALSVYQKKITPYLDGSLSPEENAEFEAFVLTHPEFEEQIKNKQQEINFLKSMIPEAQLSPESAESLAAEFKSSIFNLLKEEPKTIWDSLRIKWEEWRSRQL